MAHRFHNFRTQPNIPRSERGYILLLLMLFVALLAIAAGALAPSIAFRVKRDREEEMIHRGTQYSRAIRHFVKKTGRYPTRLEELENTNNVRFLRRRYQDPITGKDFKLLHVGEVQLTGAPGLGIGVAAMGGNTAAAMAGNAAAAGGAAALLGAAAASGALGGAVQTPPGGLAPPAADAADSAGQDANPANPASPDVPKSGSSQPGGGIGSGQLSSAVFGGGPIVGVASTSKAQSIREFNHKNHYKDWQFIYDPTMDRSNALITTPAQPALQMSAPPVQSPNSSSPNSSTAPSPGAFGGMQSAPPAQPTQPPQ